MTTVSIVVHKTPPKQLSKALGCLERSQVKNIYVVDNSPTEDLKKIACEFNRVIYLKVPNDGFGAAHNVAIKKAMEEGSIYHLVMNADVWWEGDIISNMEKYMETNQDVGLVSPKTFYPTGELQFTCRMLPTPMDLFCKRFLPPKISSNRMNRYLLVDHDHNKELNCPYLLGSFMFFRVKALEETGIFDESFFMYPEDIDITRRLHEHWKTMYWPEVTIIHEHQQASRKNFKMFRIHFVNMIKYFNKWGWIKDKKRKEYNKILVESIKKNVEKV